MAPHRFLRHGIDVILSQWAAARTVGRSGSPAEKRALGSALLIGLVAIGVLVKAVAAATGHVSVWTADNPNLARLAKAVETRRVIKPRLTGGFAYAACVEDDEAERLITGLICRGPANQLTTSRKLADFAAGMRESQGNELSSDALHTNGVWDLLWPNLEGSVEKAVSSLRVAAEADPANAAIQSDLAAALLVRAEVDENPQDLIEAIAAADSALVLNGSLVEAQFNRALALDWLFLHTEAEAAWQHYRELDVGSPWVADTEVRLRRLLEVAGREPWETQKDSLHRAAARGDGPAVQRIVGAVPSAVRDHVNNVLLPAWAAALQDRAPNRADSLLKVARFAADAMRTTSGDELLHDAIDAIDRALESRDLVRRSVLMEAHSTFAQALPSSLCFDWQRDEPRFLRAQQLLSAASSPSRHWAAYFGALCAYQRHNRDNYDRSFHLLRNILLRTQAENYPILRSRVFHMIGLIHEIRAEYADAFAARLSSLDAIVGTTDTTFLGQAYARLALSNALLRGEGEAWQHRYRALKLARAITDPRLRFSIFSRVGEDVSATFPSIAVLFQDEVVRQTLQSRDFWSVPGALGRRAEILHAAGFQRAALDDVDLARQYADSIPSDSIRAIAQGDLLLAAGEIKSVMNLSDALATLDSALTVFRDTDYYFKVARTYLALARTHMAAGDYSSADSAFHAAVQEMERERDSVSGFGERAQFLDKARPVFDEMIRFQADRGESELSFNFYEQTRGRVLLERVSTISDNVGTAQHAAYLSATDIRQLLPPDVIVVCYAVLESELLIWTVTHRQLRMVRERLSSHEMQRLVERFRQTLMDPSRGQEFRSASAELHERIIAPIMQHARSYDRVVIVPDKWLHFVPFTALLDTSRDRFLVEDYALSVAPSASLYLKATERYGELADEDSPSVLAIGNPAFDTRSFRLNYLPGAEQEAQQVAAAYRRPTPTILLGANATRQAFISQAARFDVIHFAGHAVVRPEAPLLSHMVFAADSAVGQDGALYARDLYGRRLPKTRLVVLSGCHTSTGRLSATEGPSSLARAFFAAGVPAVVASLWAVEDESTAVFFTAFHRRLVGGDDPVSALRSTQIQFIEAADAAHTAPTWAAFHLYGGIDDD